jgi:HK97 family phage major capsid protein
MRLFLYPLADTPKEDYQVANQLVALRQKKADLLKKAESMLAIIDPSAEGGEDRDFTAEEQEKYDAILAMVDETGKKLARVEALQDELRTAPTAHSQAAPEATSIIVGQDRRELDPTAGFASVGEFAIAVHAAGSRGGNVDQRLFGAAPTTYGNESSGVDGGYLVPMDFAQTIQQFTLGDDALLPLTDTGDVGGNGLSLPRDETTPWGSNGVRAYWEAEGAQGTQTKPVVGRDEYRLHKLFALVPITEELLSDGVGLAGYLPGKAGESIRYKTNDAIINGTGAGQPEGILNAAALVTQAKTASQTADTINATNVVNMFSRCLNPARAEWLINPDAYPQLPLMTIGDQPMFVPPNGFAGAPLGTLLGRPIRMLENCQTVGDVGDIIFADMKGYKSITKAGGIQQAQSMHLWFDYDMQAFRFTFRVDGHCWHSAAVTPPNSAVTRSSFVALAARA